MFAPAVKSFFRNRGPSLAVVVLILFAVSLTQGGISYTMTLGALRGFLSSDVSLLTTGLIVLRFGFVIAGRIVALQTQARAFPVNHSCQRLVHVGTAGPHERPYCRSVRVRLAGRPHASARRRADGGVEHLDLFNLVLDS
jgi:hypothetical protein